ncbi:helix-turn-helix domain-containing protein [Nocardia sp. NPDC020380]|uniref:helix-turn-helix domain-containing protein n=1 Tax=Nocardia sp. NPDC020380 TaxID=3364309 RepID=UPI0037AC2D14
MSSSRRGGGVLLTGRKYRLDFTAAQAEYAEQVGGNCRAVWNTALAQRRMYRERGAWIGYPERARQLAEAKEEHSWLKDAPGHCRYRFPASRSPYARHPRACSPPRCPGSPDKGAPPVAPSNPSSAVRLLVLPNSSAIAPDHPSIRGLVTQRAPH